MSNPSIDLNIEGNVAVLTMNNPPANTWTQDTLTALKDTVTELNANKNVYALVITGQGEKFFSAGADLNVFASGDKGVAATMSKVFGDAFEALTNFRGVSIAAINGYAMGGGLEVALACDIRIAEEQAQMALPEAKVGLLPCAGGTQNLAWLVGEGWAKRMILCGERLKADKAREIGLVEEVVGAGESLAAAMKLANQVGEQSPVAVTACKELIQKGRTQPMAHALPLERELFVQLFDTQDQKEGVNAFLEKRKANWVNG
ncbi:enoyl-CoA hydratase [Pseudoalteromonas sp. MEBiC 03607]|jgi:enoyl-CoA hydratase/carnithine racemase|uniref:enoyl-CoA hydratase n=1 Tax=Pseudoalteromonas TaxID=53246 RepID=UPI000C6756BC|nr:MULTISPECIES: enoyl-CoA hydratase [unclassified Pseudoalteromonas]MBD55754.1 enoyl-CoA hydratase [Pseudoalteromonas sp.]MCK8124435.1 enoyl-CoA hydratase [Pseudoalteromonas sp. 2CM39R]TGV20599.1 enoyl-CoA hydratase [Pseudoalteromonas sp. MEBiC 03607]TMP46016.1 enoyl-CoA hydratase [Pseudoalteromonas sp. S1650]TMP64678.1 enoyl-CoA hydratase [Pseudoalteromonas sp. S1649]|tara:strand:+ start:4358 stop:5137 length:780 start_codon:yes stop_codon:yes gene_type:complete